MAVSYQDLRAPPATATWLWLLERGPNPSLLNGNSLHDGNMKVHNLYRIDLGTLQQRTLSSAPMLWREASPIGLDSLFSHRSRSS
jgi:hypothetical protein